METNKRERESHERILEATEGDRLRINFAGREYPSDRFTAWGNVTEDDGDEVRVDVDKSEDQKQVGTNETVIVEAKETIHGTPKASAWHDEGDDRILICAVYVSFEEEE